jgi:hypothetical protein
MVAQVGYSVAERLRGQVMLYAVCTMHEETMSIGVLVWPQNQDRWFVSGLASKSLRQFPGLDLKTGGYGLVIWATKSLRQFLGLGLKTM